MSELSVRFNGKQDDPEVRYIAGAVCSEGQNHQVVFGLSEDQKEWAKFVAVDKDGEIYVYEEMPDAKPASDEVWFTGKGRIDYVKSFVKWHGDIWGENERCVFDNWELLIAELPVEPSKEKFKLDFRCGDGYNHHEEFDLPKWAKWVSVDADGLVFAWAKRPIKSSIWLRPYDASKMERIGDLNKSSSDACKFIMRLIELENDTMPEEPEEKQEEVVVGPYVGKKLNWIRDVRQTTGYGLFFSKFIVDCAMASGRLGTHEDYVDSLKFGRTVTEKYGLIDQYTASASMAIRALEGEEVKPSLIQIAVEFWKGE